jgi:hypothetical protein
MGIWDVSADFAAPYPAFAVWFPTPWSQIFTGPGHVLCMNFPVVS